jgi:RRXRR protein
MSKIFVVDTNKNPLNPIHPGRARMLLQEGKAAVWKRYPFTIILKDVLPNPQIAPLRLKIDRAC